ncbi:MAG: hypothetical protein ACE15D_13730 [Candidatus Eisenbacteria bacterium]
MKTWPRSFAFLRVALALLLVLACGCGLKRVCPRAPETDVTADCIAERVRPGDEVWVYSRSGEAHRGSLLRVEGEAGGGGGIPGGGLVLVQRGGASVAARNDTIRLALADIEKIEKSRDDSSSVLLAGVVAGAVAVTVAYLWIVSGIGDALK